MKKLLSFILIMALFGTMGLKAQSSYIWAGGLGIDFSSDFTFVGPSGKYFFSEEHAIQAELTFESNVTGITALYEYHQEFAGAEGLKWFVGGGPSLLFFGRGIGTELALRPTAGLDYKIANVPLAISFDWRPIVALGDLRNEVGAFGLGVRYVFE